MELSSLDGASRVRKMDILLETGSRDILKYYAAFVIDADPRPWPDKVTSRG